MSPVFLWEGSQALLQHKARKEGSGWKGYGTHLLPSADDRSIGVIGWPLAGRPLLAIAVGDQF